MSKTDKFNVEYTNRDIMEKLEKHRTEYIEKITNVKDVLEEVKIQTLKTNGRVNVLESQQKQNVETFTNEKISIIERIKCLEADGKLFTWKIAGLGGVVGIVCSLLTMLIGKLI